MASPASSLLLVLVLALTRVERIVFEGNHAFGPRMLQSLLLTRRGEPQDQFVLERDRLTLEGFYQSQGFLAARVALATLPGRGPAGVQLEWQVTEGPRTRIASLDYTGIRTFPLRAVLGRAPVRPGQFLVEPDLRAFQGRIGDFYRDRGYPNCQVRYDYTVAPEGARVTYTIAEGHRAWVRRILATGNARVRTPVIVRAAELTPGALYVQRQVDDAQHRVYATRLFSQVNVRLQPVELKPESVDVVFAVSELPPRSVSVGVGVQWPPRFLLSAEWEHFNLFRDGHDLLVGADISPDLAGNYEFNAQVRYRMPHLGPVPWGLVVRPFAESERSPTLTRHGIGLEAGLDRSFSRNFEMLVVNRYRRVLLLHADTTYRDTSALTNLVSLRPVLDTRDEFFNPTRGVVLAPNADWAGGFLGGASDFVRVGADARFFVEFFVVAALRLRFGAILPYGRTVLAPYYESYTLGGRNSLRGYDESSIGPIEAGGRHYGGFLVNSMFEVRSPYWHGLGLVLFLDSGVLTSRAATFRWSGMNYGWGAGLRYNTIVGPLRLDYGRALTAAAGDIGKFYLGIFQSF